MSSDSEVDIVVAASDSDSEIPQKQNQSIPNSFNLSLSNQSYSTTNKKGVRSFDGNMKKSKELPATVQKNEDDDEGEIGPKIDDSEEEENDMNHGQPLHRDRTKQLILGNQDGLTSVEEHSAQYVDTDAEPEILHQTKPILSKTVPANVQPPHTKTCLLI